MTRSRTSTRDVSATLDALQQWLRRHVAADARVEFVGTPVGAGFSSETVLFDVVDAGPRAGYALRLPPPAEAFPLFPWYDLGRQVTAIRLVGERAAVPVPRVPWYEPDPTPLGAPFFVMQRIGGRVAPDIPPYVFDGWVHDASHREREADRGGYRARARRDPQRGTGRRRSRCPRP